MKIIMAIIALTLYSCLLNAQTKNYREVMVYAPQNHEELKKQLQYFKKDSSGLAERDIKVNIINPAVATQAWLSKMKIGKNNFSFILIGKDGGEKYRSSKAVTTTKLYSIIDVMPMRMSEMNKTN